MARKKIKAGKYKNRQNENAAALPQQEPADISTKKGTEKSNDSFSVIPGSWKTNALIFLSLLVATLLVYYPDLQLGFFSVDDSGYVTDNPWIKSFSFKNLAYIFTTPYFANFSPLHLLSYMIDYAIAGPDPFIFHLSSNIWAGVVAGFVYLVALALLRNRFIAIAAAVLFVVHPAHVEAIAWISSRKDLVAAAFALPCLLAYLRYRKGGSTAKWWYILSLVLFILAIGGKLSVATFPAVLFAYDWLVEKRRLLPSLVDKIPFLIIGVIFALAVASAQPASGNRPDAFIYMVSLAQSVWLLTGLGSYTIYRVPPQAAGTLAGIGGAIVLLAVFLLPLLLRRRFPLVALFIYWIIFTYLPSQVLSFVHPVTDRYLFMPSVAMAMLVAWGIFTIGKKYVRKNQLVPILITGCIAVVWAFTTINYLNEWRDPRSVWYGALKKSNDPDVYYSMGAHYLNLSALFGAAPRGTALSLEEKENLANKIWKDDARLEKLKTEWRNGQKNGPLEKEFQANLWKLSEETFKMAFDRKGNRALPHLYFRFGVLYLDQGKWNDANKKFLDAIDECTRFTVTDVAQQLTVLSYSNLALIATKQGDFREALKWYRRCEEKQNEFNGNWIPDIAEQRKKMENTVALMSGGPALETDQLSAYNLGMYYINAANQLGTSLSQTDAQRLATEVWKGNAQLQSLQAEWAAGQHGGPVEKEFQQYLKKLAWDAFEKAVQVKGTAINSNLFFRRGVLLGEKGDMNGARKEFQAALNEAAQESNENVKKEITILSYDALGILSWREKKYKEAQQWFQTALQKQNEFGGVWVADLPSKIKQMETMSASVK
jgi:tetratricopeptide (TPR) repeat protein